MFLGQAGHILIGMTELEALLLFPLLIFRDKTEYNLSIIQVTLPFKGWMVSPAVMRMGVHKVPVITAEYLCPMVSSVC